MTKIIFDKYDSLQQSTGLNHWICDKCHVTVNKLNKLVVLLSRQLEKMEVQVNDNTTRITAQENAVTQINARIDSVTSHTVSSTEAVTQSVVNELKSIDERKQNVVVYNLAESAGVLSTETENFDRAILKSVFQAMGFNPQHLFEVLVSARRLGPIKGQNINVGDQSRPLLLRFSCPEPRLDLLSNARRLTHTNFSQVSIRSDLTKSQQAADKKK